MTTKFIRKHFITILFVSKCFMTTAFIPKYFIAILCFRIVHDNLIFLFILIQFGTIIFYNHDFFMFYHKAMIIASTT